MGAIDAQQMRIHIGTQENGEEAMRECAQFTFEGDRDRGCVKIDGVTARRLVNWDAKVDAEPHRRTRVLHPSRPATSDYGISWLHATRKLRPAETRP